MNISSEMYCRHLKLSMYRPGAMSSLLRCVWPCFPFYHYSPMGAKNLEVIWNSPLVPPLPATWKLFPLLFLWASFSFSSSSRTMPHCMLISCQDYGIRSDSFIFSITHRGLLLKHKLHLCSGFFSGSSVTSEQGPNSVAWV